MNEGVLEQASRLHWHLEDNHHRMTVDAGVRIASVSARDTGGRQRALTAEGLIREMDMAQVDMALVWPDVSAATLGGGPLRDYDTLLAANQFVSDASCRYPERLIPAGWVDRPALGDAGALRLTIALVRDLGVAIVGFAASDNADDALADSIVALGAAPAIRFASTAGLAVLERAAARHPAHPFVALAVEHHAMPRAEADRLHEAARELGLRQANVRSALNADCPRHAGCDLIRYQLAGTPFTRNLMCASDAPSGGMTWSFGGWRAVLGSLLDGLAHTDQRVRSHPTMFGNADVQRYLGGNCLDLILECYERMLAANGVTLLPAPPQD